MHVRPAQGLGIDHLAALAAGSRSERLLHVERVPARAAQVADWPESVTPAVLAALLGLTLSIGLTASSIAIMGSVEASKGGAAGSLEATSYELGTGIGITLFGVFMSSAFGRALQPPPELSPDLARQAARSIGDTYLVAARLPAEQGAALIAAGKAAFTTTHTVLLSTSAAMIGVLAIVVFLLLASYRDSSATDAA